MIETFQDMNHHIIPEWMLDNNSSRLDLRKDRQRNTYLEKSIYHIKKALSDERLTERYAFSSGFLQKLDPRVKLISTILLILLAGLTRNYTVLGGIWLGTLMLMILSGLPVLKLQKQIWGIIPLFTLAASLPGILNIFNPGLPLINIYHFSQPVKILGYNVPEIIYISKQGVMAAMYLFLRVGISLSLGVLLTLTTPVSRLLKSLKSIGVPAFFTMIIELSYRYLIMLLSISLEMFEARKVRTVGKLAAHAQRTMVGSTMAALFARSMALSEEVYQAMTARGYTGEPVSYTNSRLNKVDIVSIVLVLLAVSILTWGIVFG